MSVEEMKHQYLEVVERVFNAHRPEAIAPYLHPDFVDHASLGEPFEGTPDLDELAADWQQIFVAFPDVHFTIDHLVAEGDKVMSMWTMRGTHQARFFGIEATGNSVVLGGGDVLRFADGKMIEHWDFFDVAGLYRQLGVRLESAKAAGATAA